MLNSEMKMLAKKAVQKLDTLKPLISQATNWINIALMTKTNSPNVSNVSGKVSTKSIGRMMALAKPSISAETIKVEKLTNFRPSKSKLATQSDTAVLIHCRRKGVRLVSMGEASDCVKPA